LICNVFSNFFTFVLYRQFNDVFIFTLKAIMVVTVNNTLSATGSKVCTAIGVMD